MKLQLSQGIIGAAILCGGYAIYNMTKALTKSEFLQSIRKQLKQCLNMSSQTEFIEPFQILQTFSKNEQGIEFHIKFVKSFAKQPVAQQQQNIHPLVGPFQQGELVMKIKNYYLLFNKYPVNQYQTLLVPNAKINQSEILNKNYLSIAYDVLRAVDGFAFYNSHPEAGASVNQQNIQILPFPAYQSANILNHIKEWQFERSIKHPNRFVKLRYLKKVKHFILFFNEELYQNQNCVEQEQQKLIYETYGKLLNKCQVNDIRNFKHNLIMTQEFMMIIVRKQSSYNGIRFNALAFTGSLLAKTEQECEILKQTRIIEILENIAEPEDTNYSDVDEC